MAMFGPLGGMFGSMTGGKKPSGFGGGDGKKSDGFGGSGQGRSQRSGGFGGQPPGGFDPTERKRTMMADVLDRPDFGPSPQAGGMAGYRGGTQIGGMDRGGGIVQPQANAGPAPTYVGGTQIGGMDRGGGVVQPRGGMPQPQAGRTPMTMDQKLGMNPAYTGAPAPRDSTIAGRPSGGMPVKQKVRQQLVGSGVRGPSTPAGAVATAFGGLTGYK